MTGGAVLTAARGGAARRLVQTAVILLVVAAAAAAGTLGLTLAADSNAQFLTAFTTYHAADLAVTINASKVTTAELARTGKLPGVTQAGGPYLETFIALATGSGRQPAPGSGGPLIPKGEYDPLGTYPGEGLAVIGRASMSGPMDDIIMLGGGQWATRPGQIVLSHDRPVTVETGGTVTVTSAPGDPKLTVTGEATSVTNTALAWVAPSQLTALRPKGEPALDQMLYTFTHAATAQQVSADLAGVQHALPAGAVVNWVSWLSSERAAAGVYGLNTPFVVAFGIIGLVLAVLITANIVSAAVAAGYRRIGVLKSIGFTPMQVAAAYLAQIGLPALAGAVAGTALGDRWVAPMLGGGPDTAVGVPLWINLTVPLVLLALTGLATLVPAVRAGRLSAVQAAAAGQAPRAGHGYGVHRLAGQLMLPRPVSIGLAAPFTRPARSAATLAAVAAGLTAVILAVGLYSSIDTADAATVQSVQTVLVDAGHLQGGQALTASQQQTIVSAVRATPGTLGYVAEATGTFSAAGAGSLDVSAYSGDAAALGWDITSGAWYDGPGQVVVNTARAGTAGLTAGMVIQMAAGGKTVTARVTGQVYAPGPPGLPGALLTSQQTFTDAGIHLPVTSYEVLIAGINQGARQGSASYEAALQRAVGSRYTVTAISLGSASGPTDSSLTHGVADWDLVDKPLIRLLTIVVAVLAGLGVLNTVLMLTRERVRDLGVFKAVGMTPGQTIVMVICWTLAPAIIAAAIALPAGIALHSAVTHAIATDQFTPDGASLLAPGSVVSIYTTADLALLALAGLAIAIAGALGPATWAAVSRTTTALRAE